MASLKRLFFILAWLALLPLFVVIVSVVLAGAMGGGPGGFFYVHLPLFLFCAFAFAFVAGFAGKLPGTAVPKPGGQLSDTQPGLVSRLKIGLSDWYKTQSSRQAQSTAQEWRELNRNLPFATRLYCPNCNAPLKSDPLPSVCWNCRAVFGGDSHWVPTTHDRGEMRSFARNEAYVQAQEAATAAADAENLWRETARRAEVPHPKTHIAFQLLTFLVGIGVFAVVFMVVATFLWLLNIGLGSFGLRISHVGPGWLIGMVAVSAAVAAGITEPIKKRIEERLFPPTPPDSAESDQQ